jgi:putative thiamine transport system permease protein
MPPKLLAPLALMALLGLPLGASLVAAVMAAWDVEAWRGLLADSQTARALGLSLWTGLASTLLAVAGAAWLLSISFATARWDAMVRFLGPMLALPHVGFAIGFVALIAPSGWLLRALSPWATGLSAPPPWATTQDAWGLGLIAVLAFKEIPFILWAAATQLQRADVAERFRSELAVARSMGYGAQRAWWRVLWPQLWPRLRWPLLAVLAYGLTVVDVALVIGPTSPPTLAVLSWRWLLDASLARNAQGGAAAWLLALLLALTATAAWQLPKLALWKKRWTSGQRGSIQAANAWLRGGGFWALGGIYLAVMLALVVGSVSGVWAFPALLPQTVTGGAWQSVWMSARTLGTTLTLALASSACALVWSVAWLEWAPPRWDAWLRRVIYLPLVLPSVLWVVGVHAVLLRSNLDATWAGVWLAHSLVTIPYALIALSPAYLGFDPRYRWLSSSLGHGRWAFLLRVKWPLLRSALASAAAVAFAVSAAQYLPTLFIGAGRFATVTTEAVTLASGAQRSLTSAYAALQWLLPVLGFGLAAWIGQARRFPRRS